MTAIWQLEPITAGRHHQIGHHIAVVGGRRQMAPLQARRWVTELVHWYNGEHRHSAIGFVTPDERHCGLDRALLHARSQVYERARLANPQRWSTRVRNWQRVEVVHLNPDKPQSQEPQTIRKAA